MPPPPPLPLRPGSAGPAAARAHLTSCPGRHCRPGCWRRQWRHQPHWYLVPGMFFGHSNENRRRVTCQSKRLYFVTGTSARVQKCRLGWAYSRLCCCCCLRILLAYIFRCVRLFSLASCLLPAVFFFALLFVRGDDGCELERASEHVRTGERRGRRPKFLEALRGSFLFCFAPLRLRQCMLPKQCK